MKNENDTVIDLHNKVSGEELEKLLKMQLEALKDDPSLAHVLPPLMVWGAPKPAFPNVSVQNAVIISKPKSNLFRTPSGKSGKVQNPGTPMPSPW